MSVIKTEITFPSVSGLAEISALSFKPEDPSKIRAVFQIAHGMAEHKERYEKFATKLAENGFAVYINDHLGHGKSVKSQDELGFFGDKDGWKNFVEDCHKLLVIAKQENPNKPCIFFGHSMGSFVCRAFTFKYYKELVGAVICGTSGPNKGASAGVGVASTTSKFKGDHHRSTFIDNMAFGNYNKKFEGETDYDWLTRDSDEVRKYIEDPLCGFVFTANGYRDLFSLLNYVNSKDWFNNYPKQFPILLISGTDDPVGAYGKGVEKVKKKLEKRGKTDVTMKLYQGGRHEILNDRLLFDQIVSDVLSWSAPLAP